MKLALFCLSAVLPSLGLFVSSCTEDTTNPSSSYSTEKKQARLEWAGAVPDTNPLRAPMAVNATAFFYISNFRELLPFAISSEDPQTIECFAHVDEFNQANGTVRCTALKEGSANIQITSSETGDLIDRFALNASPIARIEGPKSISLAQHRILAFEFFPYNKDGVRLVGSGGLNYEARGPIKVVEKNWRTQLSDFLGQLLTLGFYRGNINSEVIQVEAGEAMTDSLLIVSAASGVSVEVPVKIDTSTPVARIQLDLSTPSISVGESFTISARAYDREGFEVKDPICRWNLQTETDAFSEISRTRNTIVLKANRVAELLVTCTIQTYARSIRITAK